MLYTVVDCGSLTDPDNGQVSTTTTTYTSTADYTCDTGYSLVGVNQRNCTAAGTWTDGEPTCNSEDHKYPFCKLYPFIPRKNKNIQLCKICIIIITLQKYEMMKIPIH